MTTETYVYVLQIKCEDDCEDDWNSVEIFSTEKAAKQAARDNSGALIVLDFCEEYDPNTRESYSFCYDGENFSYIIRKRQVK